MADGLGVVSSALCAIHCLAAPALLVAGTALPAAFLADERFHQALLLIVLPAAGIAFAIGCRKHKDQRVLVMAVVGVLGLVLASTLLHDLVGETGERAVTVGAAGFLIAAHVRNYRLCRTDRCEHSGASADDPACNCVSH